jgi:serine/threonine protein kinase
MPAVSVQCPHCSRSHSIDDSLIGRRARCKHCGNPFSLSLSAEIVSPGSGFQSTPGATPPTPPASAPVRRKIGRFLIQERLGAGACGAVYRALDPTLERDVALKVPHPEFQCDPEAVDRFLHEAKAAAKLHHPYIVTVFEAGTDGDTSYIASAFIAGRSLAAAIGDGPFEPRRAARIVAALAGALHAAHQQGIIHRDVKPANVLLDSGDWPHLTDFGLARLAGGSSKLTQVGSILGTPAYVAPEHARGGSNQAGPASDQYSLGVTFYELLSGQVPFGGPIEVVNFNTLHTPAPPLRCDHPDVPAELQSICLKTLAKQPEERYASCRELANDLGSWLAGRVASVEIPAIPAKSDPTVDGRAGAAADCGSTARQPARLTPTVMEGPFEGESPSWRRSRRRVSVNRRLPPWRLIIAAVPTMALLLPFLGAIFYRYVKTNHGTVKVELNDPSVGPEPVPNAKRPIETVAAREEASGGSTASTGSASPRSVPPPTIVARDAEPLPSPASTRPVPASLTVPVTFTARAIDANCKVPAAELLDSGWEVPYKAKAPVLNGRIEPDEYGPALAIDVTDHSPLGHVYWGSVSSPQDFFAWMWTAYTPTDLFIAFLVRDDHVLCEPGRTGTNANDGISLFLDGDGMGNDWKFGARGKITANPEGFSLDIHQAEDVSTRADPSRSDSILKPVPGGYVVEFRVPLAAIDTLDGPGERPLAAGSTMNFEAIIHDRDGPGRDEAFIDLWPSSTSPYRLERWEIKLHLGAIGLQADHRLQAPVLDGVIEPGEYGPGVTFNDDATINPGRVMRGWSQAKGWGVTSSPPSREDSSATVFTGCTDTALFIAARVRDDEVAFKHPRNGPVDGAQLFLDADRRPNDFLRDTKQGPIGRKQNQEGCFLESDASGRKWNPPGGMTDKDWDVAAGAAPRGYIIEFRVPLKILDTRDGPGQESPGPGSTIRCNLSVTDYDPSDGRDAVARGLWLEPAHTALFGDLEPSWVVPLHLARPVRYELIEGPPSAVIDPDTGVFRWTPGAGRFDEQVTIRATDRGEAGLRSERVVRLTCYDTGEPAFFEVRPFDSPVPDGGALLPPLLAVDTSPAVSAEKTAKPLAESSRAAQ